MGRLRTRLSLVLVGLVLASAVQAQDITTNLVLWLPMQEGTGTTLHDASPSNLTAAFGASTRAPTWVAGPPGFAWAVHFDGAAGQGQDDTAQVTAAAAINQLTAMTLSCWFKRDTAGELQGVLMEKRGNPSSSGWRWVFLATDALEFRRDYDSTDLNVPSAQSVVTNGAWTHAILTWTGSGTASTVHMYLNNSEVSYGTTTNGSTTMVDDSANDIHLGGNAPGGITLDGAITEVRVFSRVVSSGDRAALYAYRPGHVRRRVWQSRLPSVWSLVRAALAGGAP